MHNYTLFEEEISNSTRNKLNYSDRSVHDWYRFVLSYPPHLVREYISGFGLGKKDLLLDPFCGTGTTLVEAKKNGIQSIGIEANPVVAFASSVKTDWTVNPDELLRYSNDIAIQTKNILREDGIEDQPVLQNSKAPKLRSIPEDKQKLLIKNSISPLPLHKFLVLKDEIDKFSDSEFHKYFYIALANCLVSKCSNLRFGPEVGIGKIKDDFPVVTSWMMLMGKIISDIQRSYSESKTETRVINSDSRMINDVLDNGKVSAVITSPPYPNEKDYSRTTRLESVLLGFISNTEELRILKKSFIRSNTRGVYKNDDDDIYIKGNKEVEQLALEIERKRIELGKDSGFEKLYHRVTKLYFGGMARHLLEMQTILKPNSHLAYVVGDQASYFRVLIRSGRILANIAETLGYEVVRTDIFRKRFSTATQSYLNEEVLILKWK